jgi:photosystem II stability/assembly factor-like uncharacterized protein
MQVFARRIGVAVIAIVLVATSAAFHAAAERDSQAGVATSISQSAMTGLYYRPLTVFSRGGRVTAAVGVPSNPQVYYMGSPGGVFKTTDAGVTWNPITDGQIGVGTIGAIAVADSSPDIVYVGTGSACPRGNVSLGDGVYKSTDGGKTWQHIGLDKAGLIGRIRIHPQNPDIAYVAALGNIFGANKERGVYRTKDGGRTWQPVLQISDRTGVVDLALDVKNPSILIAGLWTAERKPWSINSGSVEGGLYRTTDGGDNWRKLTNGLPSGTMVGRTAVSISLANPKRVYAQIEAGDDKGGVFRSDDGGDSWARINATRTLQQRAFYYTHIYADPIDQDTVYALNTGAYRSTDGGKTFGSAGVSLHGDHHDLWINPTNNKTMISANDGGVGITMNGTTWSTQDNQPTAEIYRLEVDTRWPYWVYGSQQDNSSIAVPSNNVGETYSVGGGESGYIAVDPRNPNLIYAGNYGGLITRTDRVMGTSEDVRVYADAETGQRALDMKYRFQWNAPIRLSPHNPDVVYMTSQYVHRSKDGGNQWERISGDLTRNDKTKQDYSGGEGITRDSTGVEVYSTVFSFEESPATAGLLWAGSDDGLVHISRDNGRTWQNVTPPGLPELSTVNSIDLSAKNPGHAVVAAYRYMLNDLTPLAFKTTDYGRTWKRIADGTNGIPVGHFIRVVREDPDRPGLLFAGTEYGMYTSYDDGARWQRFQLNLPAVPIMDLKIYRRNLIVATEGRAFWILDALPIVEQLKAGTDAPAAIFFKPADAYRGGGRGGGGAAPGPTFYYWFKDVPTEPVTLQVSDTSGMVMFTSTAQPGAGTEPAPPPVIAAPAAAGRGGAGGAGAGGRGGGGGGRGGGFGGPGAGGPAVGAHKGLNVATWNPQYPAPPGSNSLFTIPQGIVMWGGGGGMPKAAPGVYTAKVSMGSWSQSQTFRLSADPRYQPAMTDAEGAAQLKMALEVGAWTKQLYDQLAKLRDAKKQAADIVAKTPTLAAAGKTFGDKLVAVEGDMTQLRGEAGQDALNFPGRMDNQVTALYGNIISTERKLPSSVTERYADLKPQYEQLMARAAAVLATDVAAFNAAATRAGTTGIVIK